MDAAEESALEFWSWLAFWGSVYPAPRLFPPRSDQPRAVDIDASFDLAVHQIQLFLTGTDPLLCLATILGSRWVHCYSEEKWLWNQLDLEMVLPQPFGSVTASK